MLLAEAEVRLFEITISQPKPMAALTNWAAGRACRPSLLRMMRVVSTRAGIAGFCQLGRDVARGRSWSLAEGAELVMWVDVWRWW